MDLLVDDVNAGFNDSDSSFYHCFLQKKDIASNADILHDPCSESGIGKIQDNCTAPLTHAEEMAFGRWLLPVWEPGNEAGVFSNGIE